MLIILILPIFEYLEDETTRDVLGWVVNALVMGANIFLMFYIIVFLLKRFCKLANTSVNQSIVHIGLFMDIL